MTHDLSTIPMQFGPFYLLVPQSDGTVQLQGVLGSMLTNITASLNMT